MQITIDRFEGDYAVCEKENREMMDIPKSQLPLDAKEGDLLKKVSGEWILQPDIKKEREDRIQNLMNDLWED